MLTLQFLYGIVLMSQIKIEVAFLFNGAYMAHSMIGTKTLRTYSGVEIHTHSDHGTLKVVV